MVAKQAVGIVLFQLVGVDVYTVILVQAFACAYPQLSVFVGIETVDRELRQAVIGGQVMECNILSLQAEGKQA